MYLCSVLYDCNRLIVLLMICHVIIHWKHFSILQLLLVLLFYSLKRLENIALYNVTLKRVNI